MAVIFNWLNLCILKPLCTKRGCKGIHRYERWFEWQLKLADLFGGADLMIIGDSNAEVFCKRKVLNNSTKIILTFGVGGTTIYDWVEYFYFNSEIYDKISMDNKLEIVFNIGGNNILRSQMPAVESGFKMLKGLFPRSWNCTVPPLRYQWLAAISGIPCESWKEDVKIVNDHIHQIWKRQAIDLYSLIYNLPGDVKNLCLKDAVHYSDFAVRYIFKCLRYI